MKTLRVAPLAAALSAACTMFAVPSIADEGQWQPYQMAQLQTQLTAKGIQISGAQLADLNAYPMNAIVSLGYCSASFVSPNGLVITNHHCGYGAIQQNSTAEKNLIEQGFLAKNLTEELPAGANERLYVTELVQDVTADVTGKLAKNLTDLQRFNAVEANRKALIQQCEADANYRMGNRVLAELIGGLAGGAFIGWVIDQFAGTSPGGLLVMLFMGVVVAFRNIIRISSRRPE